jgi:hypothetical protein
MTWGKSRAGLGFSSLILGILITAPTCGQWGYYTRRGVIGRYIK